MLLSCWSYTLGLILVVFGGVVLVKPTVASRALNALPRSKAAGHVLSVLAWAWAAYAVYSLDLDIINPYKYLLPFLLLAVIPLTWFWMGNLLSCRAFGGILTLFPYALLITARHHPSAWRLVLVTLAYIAIVQGMVFLLYPWKMRQQIVWFTATPLRFRSTGFLCVLLGFLLIALGAMVLR